MPTPNDPPPDTLRTPAEQPLKATVLAWMRRHKILTGLCAFILVGGIGNLTDGGNDGDGRSTSIVQGGGASSPGPSRTSAAPRATHSTTPSPTPTHVVTTKQAVETAAIPHGAVTREDPTRAKGSSAITTVGVDGVETRTYDVTYTDGVETARKLVSTVVTTKPIDQVTSIGTYVAPPPPPPPSKPEDQCDPNYIWACVPIDSDVDCAGGSGNGPSYVDGPVKVVGSDIYDLDSDGDGIGCEA